MSRLTTKAWLTLQAGQPASYTLPAREYEFLKSRNGNEILMADTQARIATGQYITIGAQGRGEDTGVPGQSKPPLVQWFQCANNDVLEMEFGTP